MTPVDKGDTLKLLKAVVLVDDPEWVLPNGIFDASSRLSEAKKTLVTRQSLS